MAEYAAYYDLGKFEDDPDMPDRHLDWKGLKRDVHIHGGNTQQKKAIVKRGVEVGEIHTFYCNGFKKDFRCQKKIRAVHDTRVYNHANQNFYRMESNGRHHARCDYRQFAKMKLKKTLFKETIEENKDRKPNIIVEQVNKKFTEAGIEEEKISFSNTNQLAKAKNNINWYKNNANNQGQAKTKINSISDLEAVLEPYK